MARFVIAEDRAVWVREFSVVEADSEEDAREMFYNVGEADYLGFSLKDSVARVDSQLLSIEQTDAMPYMDHSDA